jgi:hypothetical protein
VTSFSRGHGLVVSEIAGDTLQGMPDVKVSMHRNRLQDEGMPECHGLSQAISLNLNLDKDS